MSRIEPGRHEDSGPIPSSLHLSSVRAGRHRRLPTRQSARNCQAGIGLRISPSRPLCHRYPTSAKRPMLLPCIYFDTLLETATTSQIRWLADGYTNAHIYISILSFSRMQLKSILSGPGPLGPGREVSFSFPRMPIGRDTRSPHTATRSSIPRKTADAEGVFRQNAPECGRRGLPWCWPLRVRRTTRVRLRPCQRLSVRRMRSIPICEKVKNFYPSGPDSKRATPRIENARPPGTCSLPVCVDRPSPTTHQVCQL